MIPSDPSSPQELRLQDVVAHPIDSRGLEEEDEEEEEEWKYNFLELELDLDAPFQLQDVILAQVPLSQLPWHCLKRNVNDVAKSASYLGRLVHLEAPSRLRVGSRDSALQGVYGTHRSEQG